MTSQNMHYLYNVSYFEKLKETSWDKDKDKIKDLNLQDENKGIFEFEYDSNNEYLNRLQEILKLTGNYLYFDLYTIYPGLLIGTGNAHDISSKTGIKNGFSFDQVTGLPIIPGSSLKGILRAYFPDYKKEKQRHKEEYEILIREIIEDNTLDVKALLKDCFENNDIFIGAFPIIEEGMSSILTSDNITPHKEPTKNPIPITILKVRSGVKYRFMFLLNDGKATKEKKLNLYKQILLINGAGAKTNVGFGQFSETKEDYGIQEQKTNAVVSTHKERGEAPLCCKCKKEHVKWDKNKNDWFKTCWNCYNKGKNEIKHIN